MPITASMLYSLVTCPHRVSMDLYADAADRDDVSPFVQLLWDRGAVHGVTTRFARNRTLAGKRLESEVFTNDRLRMDPQADEFRPGFAFKTLFQNCVQR